MSSEDEAYKIVCCDCVLGGTIAVSAQFCRQRLVIRRRMCRVFVVSSMVIVRSIRYTAENRFIRFRFVECLCVCVSSSSRTSLSDVRRCVVRVRVSSRFQTFLADCSSMDDRALVFARSICCKVENRWFSYMLRSEWCRRMSLVHGLAERLCVV